MTSDLTVFFEITDLCNHRCFYCCKAFRGHPGLVMDDAALDRVLALPVRALAISGGEPSLVPERVFHVLDRANVPVTVNTNLSGWSARHMAALGERCRLNISVPSLEPGEFARITGAGTLPAVRRNLGLARKDSTIIVIVNRVNMGNLLFTVDGLAGMGFIHLFLQPDYGRQGIGADEAASAVEAVAAARPDLDIRFVSQIRESPVPCSHRCDAGAGRLVVLSTGDVVPCAFARTRVLGRLGETPLDRLRARGAAWFAAFGEAERDLCKGYM